jgi:2'-hydroxyisoflavone reductase
MKLLIIGGSRFLGRHLVTASLARDHEVTVFNRGQSNSKNPAGVETIRGDRNTDLAKLEGRRWDAVIDTCGLFPRAVTAAGQALSTSVSSYVFISSQSVYANVSAKGVSEDAPVKTFTYEQLQKANELESSGQTSAAAVGDLYGGLKALCERAAEEVMSGRVLNIRPGLIVGPYDYTDRFTYWLVRVVQGGEVLAPGRPDYAVQFIDARDLANWIVTMIEKKQSGIYNANGLPGKLTMRELLEASKAASGSDAQFTWVDEKFLLDEKVTAWSEMPLWLPEEAAPHLKGFMFVSSGKAMSAGLELRPLAETVCDTLAWYQKCCPVGELKAGISLEKEKALLKKWHAR